MGAYDAAFFWHNFIIGASLSQKMNAMSFSDMTLIFKPSI